MDEKYLIMMPVLTYWVACRSVLVKLEKCLSMRGFSVNIILIHYGSTVPINATLKKEEFQNLCQVDVLRLRCNLGHQRAICIGLDYIGAKIPCEAIIVMDCDGEDDPCDVLKLIDKYEEQLREKIVFAARTKRSESRGFQVCYALYKVLHKLLTGCSVYMGNFSIVPYSKLRSSLVISSELWSHYAASVISSRLPYCSIPTTRAKRVEGMSKMNLISLVIHGLSAISVFSEVVGVRNYPYGPLIWQ